MGGGGRRAAVVVNTQLIPSYTAGKTSPGTREWLFKIPGTILNPNWHRPQSRPRRLTHNGFNRCHSSLGLSTLVPLFCPLIHTAPQKPSRTGNLVWFIQGTNLEWPHKVPPLSRELYLFHQCCPGSQNAAWGTFPDRVSGGFLPLAC